MKTNSHAGMLRRETNVWRKTEGGFIRKVVCASRAAGDWRAGVLGAECLVHYAGHAVRDGSMARAIPTEPPNPRMQPTGRGVPGSTRAQRPTPEPA